MILGVNLLIDHIFIINCIQLVYWLPLTVRLKIILYHYMYKRKPFHDSWRKQSLTMISRKSAAGMTLFLSPASIC